MDLICQRFCVRERERLFERLEILSFHNFGLLFYALPTTNFFEMKPSVASSCREGSRDGSKIFRTNTTKK